MNKKQGEVPRVYTIGETLYDIQIANGQVVSGRPGGAMLNTAVSLGRLGLKVSLVSEFASDHIGEIMIGFLTENGVDTRLSCFFKEGKTPLALAVLDENRDAHYSFYKDVPYNKFKIKPLPFRKNDIVLFGSYFSLAHHIRPILTRILEDARKAGALIIYDPNFRKPHLKELNALRKFIEENISFADIIRGSSHDFSMIFGTHHVADTFRIINEKGCENLISTSADGPVFFHSARHSFSIPATHVEVLSTVGAGDSFNAGIIYSLLKLNVGKEDLCSLKKPEWHAILEMGVAFGTSVCETYDNYIGNAFAGRLRS